MIRPNSIKYLTIFGVLEADASTGSMVTDSGRQPTSTGFIADLAGSLSGPRTEPRPWFAASLCRVTTLVLPGRLTRKMPMMLVHRSITREPPGGVGAKARASRFLNFQAWSNVQCKILPTPVSPWAGASVLLCQDWPDVGGRTIELADPFAQSNTYA